jgi:hypothetical protein
MPKLFGVANDYKLREEEREIAGFIRFWKPPETTTTKSFHQLSFALSLERSSERMDSTIKTNLNWSETFAFFFLLAELTLS